MKRTGFIAITGRPNVGKSTLLNALVGEKISIISNKPQTTRSRITGILTKGEDQFVFVDTPGMHKPRSKLGDYMIKTINGAVSDVDAAILVTTPGRMGPTEKKLLDRFVSSDIPVVLVINKTDRSTAVAIGDTITEYASQYEFAAVVPICARKKERVDIVLDEVSKLLHEGEWFYDADELTDQSKRMMAAEIIREKLLRTLSEEIPHGIAVVIEEFTEHEEGGIDIRAEIYCEKASHKGIIIGRDGRELKTVGTYARKDMEELFGEKVYLDLWVKTKENWRDNDSLLSRFGFNDDNV
ncbi:MAG: GTPase Era [Clostridia bacterium]|nr:GTPase Era [Clostridia bacterium]